MQYIMQKSAIAQHFAFEHVHVWEDALTLHAQDMGVCVCWVGYVSNYKAVCIYMQINMH